MNTTTPTSPEIPPSLLALKETARRVLADRERMARERAAQAAADNWQCLLAVARPCLPADLMPFTDVARPGGFTGETRRHWFAFATTRARHDLRPLRPRLPRNVDPLRAQRPRPPAGGRRTAGMAGHQRWQRTRRRLAAHGDDPR